MSTRSNIALKLREEDRFKVFVTPWGEEIKPNGRKYLYIYCHNDGYINGVGRDLYDKQLNYEEALGYILYGDRSTVGCSYYNWRGETIAPLIADSFDEWNSHSYLYILEEENGLDNPVSVYVIKDYEEKVNLENYYK